VLAKAEIDHYFGISLVNDDACVVADRDSRGNCVHCWKIHYIS